MLFLLWKDLPLASKLSDFKSLLLLLFTTIFIVFMIDVFIL